MPMTPEESYQQALGLSAPVEQPPQFEQPQFEQPQQVETQPAAPAEPAAPAQPAEQRVNPNWEAAWQDVPEPIREAQRTHFQKWDANFNALQARYRPYEEFEKQGYNPEYLSTAVEIQRALIEDPQGFVERVAEQFGLSFGEAAAAIQQQQEEQFLTPEAQRLAEIEQRQREWDERFAAEQEAREREATHQRYVQQIAGALENLHTKYGAFDNDRVVQWAAMNAQRGANPDLEVALNEMLAYEADIIQRHSKQAPALLGSSTAIAPPAAPPEPKRLLSSDELLAKALAMGPQLLGNG